MGAFGSRIGLGIISLWIHALVWMFINGSERGMGEKWWDPTPLKNERITYSLVIEITKLPPVFNPKNKHLSPNSGSPAVVKWSIRWCWRRRATLLRSSRSDCLFSHHLFSFHCFLLFDLFLHITDVPLGWLSICFIGVPPSCVLAKEQCLWDD